VKYSLWVHSGGKALLSPKNRRNKEMYIRKCLKTSHKNGNQMPIYPVIGIDLTLGTYVFVLHSHEYS
jgi:hypothetical protein